MEANALGMGQEETWSLKQFSLSLNQKHFVTESHMFYFAPQKYKLRLFISVFSQAVSFKQLHKNQKLDG